MRKQNQAGRKSRTAGRQQALSQRARRRTIFEPLEDRRMLASDALQLAYAPGTTNEYIAANPDAIAPASEADFHSDDDHVHAHVVFAPDTPQEYVDSIEDHVGHESDGDPSVASPFTLSGRWSTTASSGGGWGQGDPITLTWSIVPDGTPIPALGGISGESADPSNLVSYLGSIYGVTTANSDYTDEPWFTHFASVFDRWSEVTGITYVYEPNDDGAAFTSFSSSAPGVVNVRGDVRIGGHRIDGNSGVLAYNFYPNHGDMVIDTADNFYASTGGNSIRLRNVLAHEAGHGIGLAHVESNNAGFLMEPFINTSFDGPQFDDILGAQRHYGDAYEKTLNNTVAGATPLGAVVSGSTVTIGSNGTTAAVSPSANDFVSIDDEQDVDVFSFSVASASTVDLTLTPIGPTYNQGPQGGTQTSFNAAAQGNLNLELLDSNGTTVLALANVNGVGSPEAITNANLPAAGTYYARVTGTTTNAVQMYRLDVTNQTATVPELSVNDVSVDEDAGTMTFTVQLSATVGSNVTFDYATSDASALAGSDYTAASGSATISSGSLSVPITVSILDDAVSEPTETFQLTLSNVVGIAVADGVAIGTINDDDAPALTLTIAAGSISEADGAGATTATVARNTGTSGPLTVNLSSSDTSEATAPASVVIPDGASSVTFDIDAVDDFIADGTRIVTISASAAGHAGASDTVDVTDNDVAGVVVTPTSGLQTSESGGAATFTVVLTSQPQPDVLIRMVSSDVSEGTLSASSLTFNASNWNIPQTVTVTGVDDPIVDGDIAYTAILSNVVSNDLDYSGLNPADVSLTNLDNDTAALTLMIAAASISEASGAAATTATITRNTPTTSSLIVTLTNSDSSEISVPASVVIPNGQSSVTFNLDAVDDLLADGTKTVTLTASAAGHASASDTVDVTDNEVAALTLVINPSTVSETAGAAAATGVVTRNTEDLSQPLLVTLSSSDTSEATSAASVTILAGQASASFAIDAVDDLLDDGSKDVTFTAEASGFDSGSDNLQVTDNEVPTLSVSIQAASIVESAGSAATTVTISRNSENISSPLIVTLTSDDTSEATIVGSATIPSGASSVTVDLDAVDDTIVDGDQTVTITASQANFTSGSDTVIVQDDDVKTLTLTVSPATFSEAAGSNAAFGTVTRNDGDLSSSLLVMLTSSDTSEATVPATVTIDAGQSSATFAIAAVDDLMVDGTQQVTFTASAGLTAPSHVSGTFTVDVTDNDGPALTLVINSASIGEADGAGATTATISRNSNTASALTVTLTSGDTSEAAVPATVDIPAGQSSVTFAIDAIDDFIVDGTQTVTILAEAAGHTSDSGSLDVTDNDVAGIVVSPTTGLITTEAGGTANFTVVLTSQPADDVTISLAVDDPSEAALSTGTLTFTAANWNTAQTVTVTGQDDAIVDGDMPFVVNLNAAVSNDGDYNGIDPDDVAGTNQNNDSPTLTVSIAAGAISEAAGANATTVTVSRNTSTSGDLIVTLLNSDASEIAIPSSVTILDGDSSVTFALDAVDDAIVDGTQAVTVTAQASGFADGSDNVDVTDNDALVLSVSLVPTTVSETAGSSAVTGVVTRNDGDLSSPLTVTLSSDDTSEAVVVGSVTIAANADSATFTIDAIDDALFDGDKLVTITASAANYGDGSATLNVTDDESPQLSLVIAPTSVVESAGVGAATGTVTRNDEDLSSPLIVTLASDDTTEATVPTTVTIPANSASATFAIDAVNDAFVDGTQTATITASASGYVAASASLDVQDNDTPTLIVTLATDTIAETGPGSTTIGTVTRNTDTSVALTVNLFRSDGSEASVPATVEIPIGAASATFIVTAVDDLIVDGTRDVIIGASLVGYDGVASLLHVTDDDLPGFTITPTDGNTTVNESGSTDTFDVVLWAAPIDDVVLNISSSDVGEATVGPTTLTFNSTNWNVPQTVTVTGVDDPVDDGDQLTSLTVAVNTGLTDDAWDGLAAQSVNVTTVDDDTAGITVTPTTGLVLSEAGQTDTVDIVLNSQPTADVTINVSASPVGQATVSVSSVTFTPANWNVAQTVTLAAIDDDIDEGATGVALITDPATSADAKYNGLNAIDVNGSILDNDTRGVVVSAISGPTTENGGTATFTVVLTSQPTSNVSIPLATSDASEGTVSAASVDFTPANWSTPQTITVTGADDSIVDGDVAYSIVTGAIGGGSDYAGIDPDDVSVMNEDDDVLTLTLSVNPASVSEADGTGAATGTVTRNDGDLGSELIVTLTSSDASAATVATAVTIAAGETSATFSIDAVDDALIDGTQTTTITAAATNYVSASGDLDVTDDDGIVNTAPEILTLAAAGFDNKALPGEPVELTGSFSDLDVGDTHTVIVAWGDGTTETLTAAQVNQADDTFAASHVYATGGLFTIEVTVVDSQAASDTEQTAAAVTGLRVTDGGVLQIVGTNERDDVDVSLVLVRVPQTSNSRGNGNGRDDDDDDRSRGRGRGRGDNFTYELKLQVVAVLGRGRDRVELVEYFDPEAITAIEIYLCDGNDRATVLVDDCDDSVAAIPTTVDAGDGNDLVWTGAGNDLLIGGGGNDWLLSGDGDDVVLGGAGNDGIDGGDGDDALSGGEGNDDIYGGRGNDLLIGGLGRDWLSGERDDDLLVAMRWTGEEDEAALLAVLAEWTRTDASYADKLDHLTGVAPGLNGSHVLDDSTLEDDGSRDNLEGDSGRDLFFAQMDGRRRDRLRDDRWYEAVFDIDG